MMATTTTMEDEEMAHVRRATAGVGQAAACAARRTVKRGSATIGKTPIDRYLNRLKQRNKSGEPNVVFETTRTISSITRTAATHCTEFL